MQSSQPTLLWPRPDWRVPQQLAMGVARKALRRDMPLAVGWGRLPAVGRWEAGTLGAGGAHEGSHCGRRLVGAPSCRLSSQKALEPKTPALGPQWVHHSHYKKKKKDKGFEAESEGKERKERREGGIGRR